MSDENDFEEVVDHGNISVDVSMLDSSRIQKELEREELNRQIEAFLASGGSISNIEPNVLADPPKKPTSNYGSQPI